MLFFSLLSQSKLIRRHFHTSTPRYIHPLIWVFLRPALKGVAWISGRSVRKWYRQLPSEKRTIFSQHLERQKYKYIGIFGTLGTVAAIHYITHLETSPITGRRRYMMMNMEQLKMLSDLEREKIAIMFSNQMLPKTSRQTQLVAHVATHLIQSNLDIDNVRTTGWSVRVVDTDMKNAFVLPSGDIYVTRGMLETMTNEDQLAIILGHELSHALLGHSAEHISYRQIIDVLAIFGAFIIWAVLPTDFTSFWANFLFENVMTFTTRLPYSRSLEEEADKVGLMLAAKACYDVRESVNFWQTVSKNEEEIPEFISTHPASTKRAEALKEILPWAYDIRRQCNCLPLPIDRPLGALHIDAKDKIMEPFDKRAGGLGHVPVVETAKTNT